MDVSYGSVLVLCSRKILNEVWVTFEQYIHKYIYAYKSMVPCAALTE